MHIEPDAVRAAWRSGADQAADELRDGLGGRELAGGADLGPLAPATADAAAAVFGALDTALALFDQTHEQMEACLADFVATDGESAGAFRALRGPA